MDFKDLREKLRKKLAEAIAKKQFCAAAVARELGCAQPHVSNFVHGKRGLSFEMADRLLALLELEAEDLFAEARSSSRLGKPPR